jgi:hypothetical protein
MGYKPNSVAWMEETVCSCGAGHGSGEGHTEWCPWTKVERFTLLAKAAAEFAKVGSLGAIRVQGKMMTRDQVVAELSDL